MKYLPLVLIVLGLAACSSPQKNNGNNDTVAKIDTAGKDTVSKISTYTFLHTEGRDSTRVEFALINDHVQGLMDWFPYEKDSRSGVIEGTLKNDTLHAIWSFAQERTTDTLRVEFLFKDSTDLRQKPLIANMKNGRQQTDVKAGYTILYKPSSRQHL